MSVHEALVAFFESAALDFAPATDDGSVYRVPIGGESGSWEVFAQVREGEEQVLFYSMCPVQAGADSLGEVMELLTRLNHGLVIGNFELDLDDGEIRYKTVAVGPAPDAGYLADTLMANVDMMDAYLPAIAAVVRGEQSAAEAAEAAVEG